MAFERPIEADRVEDLGLFSSFIRAPVVGTILWLLGGDEAKKAEEEERRRSEENESEEPDGDSFRDYELKKTESNSKRGPAEGAIEPWPQISEGVDSDSDDLNFPSYEKFVTSNISTPETSKHCLDSGPASRVVDELVAVMDAASLDGGGMKKRSPRRSPSKSNLTSLEDVTDKPSHAPKPSSQSNSSITKKKMSWSDEAGHQPLVEYFDDTKHSRYRRNSWRPSRSCSFDSQDTRSSRGRSQVRIIKSALKRSGSYSPPMQMYATPSDLISASSRHSSTSGMKSFRSLSVVGSTDSDSVGCDSPNESRHVPSSLQMGCGRANGGLVIPKGGPGVYPGYHVTLGTAVPPKAEGSEESKTATSHSDSVTPPTNAFPSMPHSHSGRSSNPHHFLPHHSNGYISPQYGFYVNITPPTPELFYPRPPPGTFSDKSKAALQQPTHQQFAMQKKPSPIPEITTVVSPKENEKPPLQPLIHGPQGTPSLKKNLKPTFVKKNRMGMFMSDNPHQVYPTVPFG
jgi:hypothetical protein